MASIKTAISLLFITFILYRIFLAVRSRFYHYLAFRKYGCLPPPSLPQKDPIFGIDLILEFFRTIRDHCRMQTIQANHARYGHTFQSSPFGSRVVSTIAMRNIQAVFATDMESFGIGATRHMSTQPLLGHGIISSDGPRWKRSRGLIQPVFTRRNLESLENFEVHVNRMMERIPRNGETVDLRPLFAKLVRWLALLLYWLCFLLLLLDIFFHFLLRFFFSYFPYPSLIFSLFSFIDSLFRSPCYSFRASLAPISLFRSISSLSAVLWLFLIVFLLIFFNRFNIFTQPLLNSSTPITRARSRQSNQLQHH